MFMMPLLITAICRGRRPNQPQTPTRTLGRSRRAKRRKWLRLHSVASPRTWLHEVSNPLRDVSMCSHGRTCVPFAPLHVFPGLGRIVRPRGSSAPNVGSSLERCAVRVTM